MFSHLYRISNDNAPLIACVVLKAKEAKKKSNARTGKERTVHSKRKKRKTTKSNVNTALIDVTFSLIVSFSPPLQHLCTRHKETWSS